MYIKKYKFDRYNNIIVSNEQDVSRWEAEEENKTIHYHLLPEEGAGGQVGN